MATGLGFYALAGGLAGAGKGLVEEARQDFEMMQDELRAKRAADAAEKDRGFRREENTADRTLRTSESAADRALRIGESEKDRNLRRSEGSADRALRRQEGETDREFRTRQAEADRTFRREEGTADRTFRTEQSDRDRDFRSGESAADRAARRREGESDRDFRERIAKEDRTFRSEEGDKDRTYRGGESEKDRTFRSGEADKDRGFRRGEREATQGNFDKQFQDDRGFYWTRNERNESIPVKDKETGEHIRGPVAKAERDVNKLTAAERAKAITDAREAATDDLGGFDEEAYQQILRDAGISSAAAPAPAPTAAVVPPKGAGTKADPYAGSTQSDIDWFKANAKPGEVIVIDGKAYTK